MSDLKEAYYLKISRVLDFILAVFSIVNTVILHELNLINISSISSSFICSAKWKHTVE